MTPLLADGLRIACTPLLPVPFEALLNSYCNLSWVEVNVGDNLTPSCWALLIKFFCASAASVVGLVVLWFAKTLADFEISDIAALPPLFCYNS